MTLHDAGRLILFLDALAAAAFVVIAWVDLRDQSNDIGRVGGVVVLAALVLVLYLVGRAFLGI